MRHLHFECVGGASGDMILGALIELGAPVDELTSALASLGVGPFRLKIERGESHHITGLRLRVEIDAPSRAALHSHQHDHHHDHRGLSEIERLIQSSTLPEKVKQSALEVFRALGRAEADIHGVPLEQIHFHEVGADDSIIDIVGSCWALHYLQVNHVSVGAIPQGVGVIRCAHGVYPNPAPATHALTIGMTIRPTDEPFELVTPTGAALLSVWKNCPAPPAGAALTKTAYGLGHHELHHHPNLLRASLYDRIEDAGHDTGLMLECNLDDTTPEVIGALIDDVLAAGALDVTCAPVTMKKQRPAIVLSVLCRPGDRDKLIDVMFRGSTTFGIREYPVQRTKLSRRFETAITPFGEVRVKIGAWQGEDITKAPEMDDCRKLAAEKGVSVRAVYESAIRSLR